MVQVLVHMDWNLVTWTALSWMFSGGILYLVYQLGARSSFESGLKTNSWRTVALLLGFAVCVAMFGTDYPDQALVLEFSQADWAVFLGIFLIMVATYLLGFFDTTHKTQREPSQVVNVAVPSASK